MAKGDDALDVLRSIDATLKALLAVSQRRVSQARAQQPKPIASDRDLDGPHGNPAIKASDPRDWTGPTMKGCRLSECPAEYLDLLADRYDYFADVAEQEGKTTAKGKPVAPYNRADAARCRGWAKRARAGWSGATQAAARGNGQPAGEWAPDLEDGF